LNSLRCDPKHFWRTVTGDYAYAAFGQKTGINTGSATDIENAISGAKGAAEFSPYGLALRLAYLRKREPVIVVRGDGVEGSLGYFSLQNGHAHASFSKIDACKPARA
jgi:hypothetical protein